MSLKTRLKNLGRKDETIFYFAFWFKHNNGKVITTFFWRGFMLTFIFVEGVAIFNMCTLDRSSPGHKAESAGISVITTIIIIIIIIIVIIITIIIIMMMMMIIIILIILIIKWHKHQ